MFNIAQGKKEFQLFLFISTKYFFVENVLYVLMDLHEIQTAFVRLKQPENPLLSLKIRCSGRRYRGVFPGEGRGVFNRVLLKAQKIMGGVPEMNGFLKKTAFVCNKYLIFFNFIKINLYIM